MKKIIVFIILCLFLFGNKVNASTAEQKNLNQEQITTVYNINTDKNSVWYPTTLLINGKNVVYLDDSYYFILEGSIGEYDLKKKSFTAYSLFEYNDGSDKSKTKRINDLILVNNTLWIATQSNGIFVFDLSTKKVTGRFKVTEEKTFGANENLFLTSDMDSKTIWVSSFGRLDSYNTQTKIWENWNHIYKDLRIGEPSSNNDVFIDGDIIWIKSNAHHRSLGALIKYNKKTGEWKKYRNELIGSINPLRVDILSLIVSRKYLWTVTAPDNLQNMRIAEYNKKEDSWKIYKPNDFEKIVDNILDDLKDINVNPYFDLLKLLDGYKKGYKSALEYQRNNMYPEYVSYYQNYDGNKIDNAIAKINKIPNLELLTNCGNYGRYPIFSYNNNILKIENGEIRENINILHPIEYRSILASVDNTVILATNRGMDIVNFDKNTITHVSDSEFISNLFHKFNPNFDFEKQFIKSGDTIYICVNFPDEMDSIGCYMFEVDMDKYTLNKTKMNFYVDNFSADKNIFYIENSKKMEKLIDGKWISISKEEISEKAVPAAKIKQTYEDNRLRILIDYDGLKVIRKINNK